ncbi:MAG: glutamate 5-kinase [Candidatus Margulisbacteria bacterium]|nr:glutamate 5-kinase [Candidatus Margulisiibacteriota bacterium]
MASNFHTIVIKIGSSSLTNSKGNLDHSSIRRLAAEIAKLVKEKKKVILVSSGAIVSGAEKLKIGAPKSIPEKQAAAAVGQARLIRQYEKAFEKFKIPVAQVLLTRDEMHDHNRYAHAHNCFAALLKEHVVPIVNENDAVAIDEIKIGDNDNLAALTAKMVKADLLILLTDVDGFYMKDNKGDVFLATEIREITREVEESAGQAGTQLGTGGMLTKIQAAKICSDAGIPMAILNSRKAGLIKQFLAGKKVGTLFIPKKAG